MNRKLDWNKYLETASKTVAEGIVMLKNRNEALPLKENETVSVFGRIQFHYYKSGTGSGGMVNVSKVTGILDGLLDAGVKVNTELLDIYRRWDSENPFDVGTGWGCEPWAQKEMPLTDEIVSNAASAGSTAIVIIGRTAGEEQDFKLEEGSYYLTETEKNMLTKVRSHFEKVVVLLNVGGLIDMEFIENCNPDSILYVWQGGMTGGTGTAAVLTGRISPSGKLPDTIAYNISDYPSDKNFGDPVRNFYCEDIYTGYRWFETFSRNTVRYPFGFGLSYTDFDVKFSSADFKNNCLYFRFSVKNIGKYRGKEVVQLYYGAPQGKLGKPSRVLCAYEKTKELAPDEVQDIKIIVKLSEIASYDDSGVTGNQFCWVLEEGSYNFYAGTNVRNAMLVHTHEVDETTVVKQCVQALAPVLPFRRVRPEAVKGGFEPAEEDVPLSAVNEEKRRLEHIPDEIQYTGNRNIKLVDVLDGNNSMDEFIAQLSDDDLACIIRGEGMGSPRVTAGTASAFGGVSDSLISYGIPTACCADGPSGMRLDCGTKAFSLPNGTLIASTFNRQIVTELFSFTGLEMCANNVDCLLGPGINIHRHPLNGRNFEYFSEDPYLTGTMAAAEINGLHTAGVTGTIKHFCCNNQETRRHFTDSAVSERALREIYLKGFEIAVRDGNADTIMTSYGAVNGLWTAGNFDLNTTILRDDWGFKGLAMTDWWANINVRGQEPDRRNFAAMARAQNDIYMVCADGSSNDDTTAESLENGSLARAELQRNAANICSFLMTTNAMKTLIDRSDELEIINRPSEDEDDDGDVIFYDLDGSLKIDLDGITSVKGKNYKFALKVKKSGIYRVTVTASSEQSELAQIPVTLFVMGTAAAVFTWNGTGGASVSFDKDIPIFSRFSAVRLYFAQSGLDMKSISFELVRQADSVEALAFVQNEE